MAAIHDEFLYRRLVDHLHAAQGELHFTVGGWRKGGAQFQQFAGNFGERVRRTGCQGQRSTIVRLDA